MCQMQRHAFRENTGAIISTNLPRASKWIFEKENNRILCTLTKRTSEDIIVETFNLENLLFLRCTRGLMWIWTPSWLLFCIPGKFTNISKLGVSRDCLYWSVPKSSRIIRSRITQTIRALREFKQTSFCSSKLHNIQKNIIPQHTCGPRHHHDALSSPM